MYQTSIFLEFQFPNIYTVWSSICFSRYNRILCTIRNRRSSVEMLPNLYLSFGITKPTCLITSQRSIRVSLMTVNEGNRKWVTLAHLVVLVLNAASVNVEREEK